ncbi:MAG: hypothetical protein ACRBFS_13220 [Aureispira sp.]
MTTINNDWYIYENDIYGVDALLDFGSKEELMEYVLDEDFADNRIPEGLSEKGKAALQIHTDQFRANEIDQLQYAAQLLDLIIEEEGEIESLQIQDFERLCEGKGGFAELSISVFCDRQGIEAIKTIPTAQRPAFKTLLENALGDWIG